MPREPLPDEAASLHRSGPIRERRCPTPPTGLVRAEAAGEARLCPPRNPLPVPPRCSRAASPEASELLRAGHSPDDLRGIRPAAPPHALDPAQELRGQLHVRLAEGMPIPLPLGDEPLPPGPPGGGAGRPQGRLVQRPAQERPPTAGDAGGPRPLPGLEGGDVEPGELAEL